MRTLTVFWNTGEVEKASVIGTNPQLQRTFYLGRNIMGKTIEATTIEG